MIDQKFATSKHHRMCPPWEWTTWMLILAAVWAINRVHTWIRKNDIDCTTLPCNVASTINSCQQFSLFLFAKSSLAVGLRVATRPVFPGMSRICAMLSRVPARPAPGRQMSRISLCSQNDNNNKVVIGVSCKDVTYVSKQLSPSCSKLLTW